MAQFTTAVNVWKATDEELMALQPGQWVYAGDDTDKFSKGRWCGIRGNGIKVVAWYGNMYDRSKNSKAYLRTLLNYAKG